MVFRDNVVLDVEWNHPYTKGETARPILQNLGTPKIPSRPEHEV